MFYRLRYVENNCFPGYLFDSNQITEEHVANEISHAESETEANISEILHREVESKESNPDEHAAASEKNTGVVVCHNSLPRSWSGFNGG